MLELAEKWLHGTITPEEKTRLFQWYDSFDDTELTLDSKLAAVIGQLREEMLRDIRKKSGIGQKNEPHAGHGKIHRITKLSAAAAILLLLFTGGWFYTAHSRNKNNSLAATIPPKNSTQPGDIPPGSNKAILTLGDGSKVSLDSAGTGRLSIQGNAQVIKNGNGQLQYATTGQGNEEVVFNILSTPKGGQYHLQLQDGTNVWLNAGSSIRYPTAFTGDERKVEVTGEAYFEVAKNTAMPFHVSVAGSGGEDTEIEVLGTSFNINAYKDEPDQETSLLEGAVRVTRDASSVLLKPAQQAVAAGRTLRTATPANIEQTIAWKNGAFEFDDADVPTIMRQIARWYDVEVVYEGQAPGDTFTGRFSRNTSLTGVLQILHLSGVRLAAENKKIVIKS